MEADSRPKPAFQGENGQETLAVTLFSTETGRLAGKSGLTRSHDFVLRYRYRRMKLSGSAIIYRRAAKRLLSGDFIRLFTERRGRGPLDAPLFSFACRAVTRPPLSACAKSAVDVQRQRMDLADQIRPQGGMHGAVPRDAALPCEGRCAQRHVEVALAAAIVPCVPGMARTVIADLQVSRLKSRFEFHPDRVCSRHFSHHPL